VLIDPESYEIFVKRQKQHRDQVSQINSKESARPGSGNVWKGKVTKSREFNLATENKQIAPKSPQIRSINKVHIY
jgi:hypothetical protein